MLITCARTTSLTVTNGRSQAPGSGVPVLPPPSTPAHACRNVRDFLVRPNRSACTLACAASLLVTAQVKHHRRQDLWLAPKPRVFSHTQTRPAELGITPNTPFKITMYCPMCAVCVPCASNICAAGLHSPCLPHFCSVSGNWDASGMVVMVEPILLLLPTRSGFQHTPNAAGVETQ
jgi:hypothetical protein